MDRILLEIYFGLNLFIAGIDYGSRDSSDSRLVIILATVINLLFSIIIYILQYIVVFIKWIVNLFQLNFFFKFLFTKKFNNLSQEKLKEMNNWGEHWKKKTLTNRLRRLSVKLVNKRNNYNLIK